MRPAFWAVKLSGLAGGQVTRPCLPTLSIRMLQPQVELSARYAESYDNNPVENELKDPEDEGGEGASPLQHRHTEQAPEDSNTLANEGNPASEQAEPYRPTLCREKARSPECNRQYPEK